MENVRNIEILNLSKQKEKKKYLVSEPNYHITNVFIEYLLAIEMKKSRHL